MTVKWTESSEATGWKPVARTGYEGATLGTSRRDDSLWESYSLTADVWDEGTQQVRSISYWGGYWGTYRSEADRETHDAMVDATDAVRAKAYAAEFERLLTNETNKAARERVNVALQYAARKNSLAKGVTAEVVKGRKVAKGTTGVVIWIGNGQYGERVGLKDADGNVHWTASSNVEVRGDLAEAWDYIQPDDVERDRQAARTHAARMAEQTSGFTGYTGTAVAA